MTRGRNRGHERVVALPAALALAAVLALVAACGAPRAHLGGGRTAPAGFRVGSYLPGAHSHNDYDRKRPLYDALANGFASVEADIALLDGVLYIVHDSADASSTSPTLVAEYLDPLRAIAAANGGRIFGPNDPPLQLLIDVKTEAVETHEALHALLAEYDDLFTSWTIDGTRTPGPVVAVLSGHRPLWVLRREPVRFAAVDGRIYEDRRDASRDEMPLVSVNWDDTEGVLGSAARQERLDRAADMVRAVHQEGRRIRFWGTPDRADFWRDLRRIRVDYIGADHVDDLARFLRDGTDRHERRSRIRTGR